MFVRECPGPPDAPVVFLIHGLGVTADVNWFGVFDGLQQHFRAIAVDLRGHGRGHDPGGRFRLEDCADDIAALAGVLDVDELIAVGYSMGGMIAQLLWRRYRGLVSGLVLCSTARNCRGSLAEAVTSMMLPGVEAALRMSPAPYRLSGNVISDNLFGGIGDESLHQWARAESASISLQSAISATRAAAGFTSHDWIGQVDVPTAVVVTTRDRIVRPSRQYKLARSIPAATMFEIDADHGVCVQDPVRFSATLVEACRTVASGPSRDQRSGGWVRRLSDPGVALPTAR
jgi:3-oxoadipate enol-lactonase